LFCAVASFADNLIFYSGDLDLNNPDANGLANENDAIVGGNPYGAATYQNFTTSQNYTVTGLFTNNQSMLNPGSGYWEVRSGVSEGNGGTLIASGTASGANFSHTPTGRSGFGYDEYTDLAQGLSINLAPGTYWFSVVPQDPNNENRSFNSNTFGLNQVLGDGVSTTNDLQFFNSDFFGANFTNADNEGVFPAFSGGVYASSVPEPSSMIMLGSGLLAAAGMVRRRLL
jgi:hypothetical protein